MESEDQPQNRRARRASEKKNADQGEIKDRNQRLRAEVRGTKKRATSAEKARAALDAQERLDDVLLRSTDAAGKFLGSNFNWLQYVIVLGAAGGIGYLFWNYRSGVDQAKRGDQLAEAFDVTHGRLASDAAPKTSQFGLVDTRPEFADPEARAKASQEKWAALASSEPALELHALLAQAGGKFDGRAFEDAIKSYETILSHPKAQKSPLIQARAAEGILLSYEALGNYDKALDAVKRLQGVAGQAQLATYHEARLALLKGDKTRAKELVASLSEKLKKSEKPGSSPGYLSVQVSELEKTLDPKPTLPTGGLSPETLAMLQKQLEELQKNAAQNEGQEGSVPFDPIPLLPETDEPQEPSEGTP